MATVRVTCGMCHSMKYIGITPCKQCNATGAVLVEVNEDNVMGTPKHQDNSTKFFDSKEEGMSGTTKEG